MSNLWHHERGSYLDYFAKGPFSVSRIKQDRLARELPLHLNVLKEEGLIFEAEPSHLQLTNAGRVLRAFYTIGSSQGGACGAPDLRKYADVKKMDAEALLAAIAVLETKKLIVARPTPRAVKWELVG